MKVHSIGSIKLTAPRLTEAQKMAMLGPFAERWGNVPKGAVLPATHVLACARVKVAELPKGHIPARYFEALEHNQQIASCCRHPEDHEIEAFKSHPDEVAPDIYVFHCTCGRKHRRFCVGYTDDRRPTWVAEAA
jgi:hypothetical protein